MDRQVDGGIHNIPWLKQSVYRQLVKALIRHKMHNPGPVFANSVDPDQLASSSDLAQHCLSLNIWIYIWQQPGLSAGLSGSVGCAVRLETRRSRFNPLWGWQHSFMEIDHEIFSTVILSLPLIQEGQLSVSCERMCKILVNCLED